VSVQNTRLDGMTDHFVIGSPHPWLVRHPMAIDQTIAFLKDGRFVNKAPSSPHHQRHSPDRLAIDQ
jgi:hypothetical protein